MALEQPPGQGLAREDLLATLGLIALALLIFEPFLFSGRILYERDILFIWHPYIAAIKRALAAGSWPVWDRTTSFGQPLWADPSVQLLYPFTPLHLLLPPTLSYTVFAVFHVALAAVGTYGLARQFAVSRSGAFVAGAVAACSGPLLSHVSLWHHCAGVCWMPWVLLAAEAVDQPRRARQGALLALALTLQILAGSADAVIMTGLLVAARILLRVDWRRPLSRPNAQIALAPAVPCLLALALSAPLWLPALDLLSRSERRELAQSARTLWSVHPASLIQTALPLVWDYIPLRPDRRADLFEGREPFLRSLYLGLPAIGLVAAAWAGNRRSHRCFWAAALLGSVLIACGRHLPFYGLTMTLLPPLRILRYPVKAFAVTALAFSLLTGIGFDAWISGAGSRRRFRVLVAGVEALLFVLAATALLAAGPRIETWGRILVAAPREWPESLATLLAPTSTRLTWAAVLALVGLGLGLAARWPRTGIAMAALAVGDLALWGREINPAAPPELLRFRPPMIDALLAEGPARIYVQDPPPGEDSPPGRPSPRVLRIRRGVVEDRFLRLAQTLGPLMVLTPPVAGRFGVEGSYDSDTRGLYPLPLAQLTERARACEGRNDLVRFLRMGSVSHVVGFAALDFPGLERLAEFESLSSRPVQLLKVPAPLPRAYAVGNARIADGEDALRILLDPGFDFSTEVILAKGEPMTRPGFQGACRVLELRPDQVVIEATLSAPGVVVLTDSHDPGWQVRVDGKSVPLLRANLAFRGVAVPAGRHLVEHRYRPFALMAGLGLSLCGMVAGVVVVARLRRRRAA